MISMVDVTNYTDILSGFLTWSMQGYVTVFGFVTWPLFFSGVIGYVYTKQQSYVAVSVVILIIIAGFTDLFIGVNDYVIFLHIITALIISGLLLIFFIKLRGR